MVVIAGDGEVDLVFGGILGLDSEDECCHEKSHHNHE